MKNYYYWKKRIFYLYSTIIPSVKYIDENNIGARISEQGQTFFRSDGLTDKIEEGIFILEVEI